MIELQNRVQNQFQDLMDSRQREMERWPAVQGLSNDQGSADVSGMSGWVWVRIGNDESVARAFNNKTSHRNGLTVWVGKLPEQPMLFQVTDERQPYFNESAGGGAIGPHAAQHVWPSEDPTFVRYRQFADCRVSITNPASLSVEIADGYYFIEDELFYFAGSTQDLTAYVPAAGRVWVLLEMKPAGLNISSHATSSFALDTIPKVTDKSYWRTASVALRPAQTAVTDYPNDQHIFDLRQSKIAGSESDPSAPAKNGWNPGVETEVAMSWDDVTRTLQLSPVGSTFEFWTEGIKRTKSSNDSVQITDTEGWWYIYYDGDTLTASQVVWDIADDDKTFVAIIYWDATNNEAVFGSPGWEMHSWVMDAATHTWAHHTIGTRFEDGLTISENPADQLEVTAGGIHDEDIMVNITDGAGAGLWEQDLSPLQAYKLYKLGAGGDWRQGGAFGTTPCILDGGNDVQWNQFVAGAWQLTAAGANQYCAYWVLATPMHDEPIVIFTGQGAPAANIDAARDNNDISGMDFTDAGPEFKVLFRVMVRNIPGGGFYEVSELDDFRAAALLPSTGFVATEHGSLSGRGNDAEGHPTLYPLFLTGVTRTVGAAGDHLTIQAAIDWFANRRVNYGANVIDVDAAAYDEAVEFSDIVLAAGATLTLEGDTRALVGISYVDGASCNRAAIANGGSGVCALANAGNNITVTGTVGNPDYDAAGLVNGDRILVYDNAGATTIETIDSVLNNVITLTAAAPAVGNDATSICILPDRSIERTAAGPCIQVSSVRGVSIDGWYLESAAGASCHGIAADTAALVVAENTATNVEDNGIWADAAYSTIRSVGGAVSCWGSTHAARATSAAQVILNYGVSVACTTGFSCAFFGFFFGTRMIAVEATTGFTATHFSYLYAGFGTARQNTTGYFAGQRGYTYAAATNANNNGNGADYNPAVSDAFGNNNGSITWS